MIEYLEDGNLAVCNGLKFRRDKKTGYYLNAKTHKRLHVYVWESFNGPVPEGYQIHHKDLDKRNNDIENLVLLTQSEHMRLHAELQTDEQRARAKKRLDEFARPAAKEWHQSDAGLQWHKEHYEQMKDRLHVKHEFICQNCGKLFESTKANSKFCCNNCKAAARRKAGIDNIIRICERCGAEYETNKYRESHYCKSCRSAIGWDRRRLQYGGSGDS